VQPGAAQLKAARISALLVSALLLSACGTSPVEPNTTAWQADIQPVGASLISGSLGAVSDRTRRRTDTNIVISGAPPSSTLAWRIRAGTCGGQRGTVVGAPVSYTGLETDSSGSASRTVGLSEALSVGTGYMVEVWSSPTGEDVLACGVLTRL
jgi:hypothetical protein